MSSRLFRMSDYGNCRSKVIMQDSLMYRVHILVECPSSSAVQCGDGKGMSRTVREAMLMK